jgi:uncharacterized cupin superfamily protein
MTTPAIPQFQPTVDMNGPLPVPTEWRPPADRVVFGDPLQRAWNLYSSVDSRFNAGIWECAAGKWRVVFTENEFCQLLAGEIVVTGDDGSERTWRAGDAFVSPAGFTGYWDVRVPARKYYVVYE